ncbi:hypothetical protein M8494_00345 [Serratia ureilytica]
MTLNARAPAIEFGFIRRRLTNWASLAIARLCYFAIQFALGENCRCFFVLSAPSSAAVPLKVATTDVVVLGQFFSVKPTTG